MTTSATENVGESQRPPRTIRVSVNNQQVELPERRVTGRDIKQAAVAQGVHIQPNFQLSVKRGNRYEVIGDDDTITVHPHQEFLAVAPDDNS
ncbi:multiubiquitin domain-containing protein [Micromonospora sp. S-DT3-3-22]|uniref:multiubiquitin domain-containing protein n=1 Tax=Micromonospora sp. S-DT3-3-22 TaxID=2755359 RepID=UPI00188DE95A|nr:multiubiquitin domain-containing protein [Micromonospora sp. S-DT3-3-22]